MEIQGNLLISIEIHDSWTRKFGILWHPVAGHWMPLRNLCRMGGIRSSDHRLLGSSVGQTLEIISGQISEHQLFGSAARG